MLDHLGLFIRDFPRYPFPMFDPHHPGVDATVERNIEMGVEERGNSLPRQRVWDNDSISQ